MKKLMFLFLPLLHINANAQTVDYRDYATGYYSCSAITGLVGVDTTHFYPNLTVTLMAGQDSFVHIHKGPNAFWDFRLRLDSFLVHNNQQHVQYYTSSFIRLDSLYLYYVEERYIGPTNQWIPYYAKYYCSKTAPLALEENIKSKLIIGQSIGFITITQSQLMVDRVKLYSIDGKELRNETLYANNSITTENLSTGIYLIAFYKNNKFIDSKRVVITN